MSVGQFAGSDFVELTVGVGSVVSGTGCPELLHPDRHIAPTSGSSESVAIDAEVLRNIGEA